MDCCRVGRDQSEWGCARTNHADPEDERAAGRMRAGIGLARSHEDLRVEMVWVPGPAPSYTSEIAQVSRGPGDTC